FRVPNSSLKNVLNAQFRANPNYQIVLFDRLSPAQKSVLNDLRSDPDLYGILLPREGTGLSIKAVSRDTALLLFSLQQPGTLPHYVIETLGEQSNGTIAQLVLDGVLEMSCNGTFVSGSDAYTRIIDVQISPASQGTIARLSIVALQYGQALEI